MYLVVINRAGEGGGGSGEFKEIREWVSRAARPNLLGEGVSCGLDKEIGLDGTYLAYFPFSPMIERSQMTPYHNKSIWG